MSYEDSPACKMLATECVFCGKPLVDAISVQTGAGPECRRKLKEEISEKDRKVANKYVYEAALAAQEGHIQKVMQYANLVEELGLRRLSSKMRNRFKDVAAGTVTPEITIDIDGYMYKIKTPFRRGREKEFVKAWRSIPGRRFNRGSNYIPISQKKVLWRLLKEFFPNRVCKGPKGFFKVPKHKRREKQVEMWDHQC